jgi:NAD(P)-dependent dehydrogenase (short-subunit alcohol dehydrogenase family)
MSTSEKVALVTGGGQGIGKGIVQRLLEDGMRVVVAEKDAAAGEEAADELARLGPVRYIHTDVADEASVRAALEETEATFGRLDALVNNAGIAGPFNGPVEQLALDDWHRVLQTNLTGAFLCVKHAVSRLRRQGGGAVINIASTRAFQSEPHTEAYAASKGGLFALTHALAISLGPDVRVNCISPGWIEVSAWQKASVRSHPDLRPVDHAQHPVGRVGEPGDVAALAAFLLSDAAGFITGQNFIIDGGMTRTMIYAH